MNKCGIPHGRVEPGRDQTNSLIYASCEDAHQQKCLSILITILARATYLDFLYVYSEDIDLTGWVPGLIGVFACHK